MKNKLVIVVGHFGSGKTEFSVNYAIKKASEGRKVRMADLDIANAYFRSREKADMLSANGVEIISNNFNNDWKTDLPALNAGIKTFFEDETSDVEYVVDVGGNPEGARVMRQYLPVIQKRKEYEMWLVVNANRFETLTAENMVMFAQAIESEAGLRCTGIINNTHFVRETEIEDIYNGNAVAREAAKMLNLPIVYTVAEEHIAEHLEQDKLEGEVFPITIKVREDYM